MSDLPVQEEIEKTSTSIVSTQNQHLTNYFTLPTSPRTSIVHQFSPPRNSEHTSSENNKQPEQLSFLRRLTLSFRRRSLRHENSRQVNSDENYCRELLNRISDLSFGSNIEQQQQAFDLLELKSGDYQFMMIQSNPLV